MFSAEYGLLTSLKLLVKAKADLDAVDKYSWSALHRAACEGYTECCRVLIHAGASKDLKGELDGT